MEFEVRYDWYHYPWGLMEIVSERTYEVVHEDHANAVYTWEDDGGQPAPVIDQAPIAGRF
jgi:hypothetical protein